jgi:hypothetical protein
MPNFRVMRITPGHLKPCDGPNIQIVTLTIAKSIVAKLTVLDLKDRDTVIACQDAILILEESAILDFQVSSFEPDSGAIVVGNLRPYEVESLDCHLPATNHPDAFSFCRRSLSNESRAPVPCSQSEIILGPDGHILMIVTGINFDNIAIPCHT